LIPPVTQSAPAGIQPSIAVLAFSDMSPEKDQEYFCDGIAEEIINSLSRVKNLRVASRTSAFVFKGKSEDIRKIGRNLGVGAVLEGSVRKAGDQLRITAQLINAADGCHMWSGRYDRELKDVFAIQDEIARSIAATLQVTLTQGESEALGKVPTVDLVAYDYYLRGKQFFYQYKGKGVEFALQMFSQAIESDPEFARAYAGIANCCSFLYMYAGSHAHHREKADSASKKALELAPESAEAWASRGVALSLKGEYDEAERAFLTAIRHDAWLFEAYYFYARVAFAQGKPEKAIELYEKASQVSPPDYQSPLLVAQIYSDLGRREEADAARLRGVQIAEARLKLNPDDSRALYMGANGLVGLGKCEQGLEWAKRALMIDPDEPMVLYNVACIQSLGGQLEEAMDSLERAVRSGLTQRGWIEHDSNLDPLRPHPRYQALLNLL
jgi:TolB-like protein/Flp pilus assembly protein TadD